MLIYNNNPIFCPQNLELIGKRIELFGMQNRMDLNKRYVRMGVYRAIAHVHIEHKNLTHHTRTHSSHLICELSMKMKRQRNYIASVSNTIALLVELDSDYSSGF